MKRNSDLKISGGKFTIYLEPDVIFTLSTLTTAMKGQHPPPPRSKELQLPYYDNFDKYPEHAEVKYFIPQIGSFEVMKSMNTSRGNINRQTVVKAPIYHYANSNPVTMGKYIHGFNSWSQSSYPYYLPILYNSSLETFTNFHTCIYSRKL